MKDARAFADRMNRMLNATVTDGRLVLTPRGAARGEMVLQSTVGDGPAPVRLHGSSLKLFVQQSLDVSGDSCHTTGYA